MKHQMLQIGLALAMTAAACSGKTITVAGDGSADFRTIQEAIAAVPDHSTERIVIHLKPGTYFGQIVIPKEKPKVTFEGEGTGKTVITYAYNQQEPNPAPVQRFLRGIAVVVQSDDFTAHDLTFRNDSGDHGQALALRIDGDRAVVYDCNLIGWQDTLMLNNGRQYLYHDTIAGRVDFIYGSGTAVFDHCEIHSRNGGHVTAASTPQDHPFGFVFMNCNLTGDAIPFDPATTNPATTQKARLTPIAVLGRPWRPYASVTFLNCTMGSHISPHGWNNWGKTSNESTARYSEYNSTGPGANPGQRVKWSHQLTKDQADRITIPAVLGGADHWNPQQELNASGQ